MQHRLRFAVGVFLAVLVGTCIAGASLAAARSLSVSDVLRLHGAGVDEDVIMSEIVVTDTVFDLDVDDILHLQEAGVSDRLLQFMVDTGRGDVAVEDSVNAPEDQESQEAYIEEQDVAHPVYVSLRWSYPVWWYDMYWYDYWYYDCHYDPWSMSWSYPCGVWYPTWYWSSRCWAPAGWGYRHHWWTHGGRSWDRGWSGPYDWRNSYGFRDGSPLTLSDHKVKVGGGNGKALVAGVGLKTRDGARVPFTDHPIRVVSRKGALAVDTHALDVRRPVRAGVKAPVTRGDTIRRPATVRPVPDRDVVRRPTRTVRNPAPGDRPVKHVVRRTQSAPKDPVVRPPRPPATGSQDAPDKPAPPPDKPRDDKQVKPAPEPRPVPPPAVQSRPAPPSPRPQSHPSGSGGKSASEPRGGNGGGGSGKTRGR